MKQNQEQLFEDDEMNKLIKQIEEENEIDKLAKQIEQDMKSETVSQKSKAKGKKGGKGKPAWAMTEKQQEDEREAEIDNLLEFAYDLDYEKYMEDFEVR